MAFIEVTWQQAYKLINKLIIYATVNIYQPQFIAVSGVKGNGSKNLKFLIQALWDVAQFEMVKGHIPVPCARSPHAALTHYRTHNALCSSTFTLSSNTPSLLRTYTTRSVTCEHKNPWLSTRDLVVRWLPRLPLDARCIAVRRLNGHPSLFRGEKTPSPSAPRSPCLPEETVHG